MPDELETLKQKIRNSDLLSGDEKKDWLFLLPKMTALQREELHQLLSVRMPVPAVKPVPKIPIPKPPVRAPLQVEPRPPSGIVREPPLQSVPLPAPLLRQGFAGQADSVFKPPPLKQPSVPPGSLQPFSPHPAPPPSQSPAVQQTVQMSRPPASPPRADSVAKAGKLPPPPPTRGIPGVFPGNDPSSAFSSPAAPPAPAKIPEIVSPAKPVPPQYVPGLGGTRAPAAQTNLDYFQNMTLDDLRKAPSVYIFFETLTNRLSEALKHRDATPDELSAALERSPLHQTYLGTGVLTLDTGKPGAMQKEEFEAMTDFRIGLRKIFS